MITKSSDLLTVSKSHVSSEEDAEKGTENPAETFDEIPDVFRGWGLCAVIGTFIINVNTWGANSAYALYLETYLSDPEQTFNDTNKYAYGIIGGLTFGSGLVFAPFINYVVGKTGYRVVVGMGILMQFAGGLMASFSRRLWEIYCTQGVLLGIGLALIYCPIVSIIPQWFKGGPGGKRNLAMGIATAGSGVGGIIYNIGLEQLLKKRSFRWSLRAQAIMCFGLNFFAFCLIRSRSDKVKPVFKVYDKLVWNCFGFLCMVFWIMFTLFGYVVLMYNLGDFTRSLGYSSTDASTVSTCVAVGIIYGRPSVGKIGDIIGPTNVTIIVSWLVAIFCWCMWIPCRNLATAIVFALIVGSLMGTIWLTMPTMMASIVGLKKLGVGLSATWISVGVFGFASPIIGLALKKDGPTSPTQYQPASIFVGLCYFMAGVSLYIMRAWIIKRNSKLDVKKDEDLMLNTSVTFKEVIAGIIRPQWQKV